MLDDKTKIGSQARERVQPFQETSLAYLSAADKNAGPALADLAPMLLTQVREPWTDTDWLCELMAHGIRLRAEVVGDHVELLEGDGTDVSDCYPELCDSLKGLTPTRTVIDGEICVLDEHGRCDIARLQGRKRRNGAEDDCTVAFIVFDVLIHRGRDVRSLGLVHRKELLRRLLTKRRSCVLRCQHAIGEQAVELHRVACEMKLEGIVMKRLNSPYACGERNGDWVKVPCNGAVPDAGEERGKLNLI